MRQLVFLAAIGMFLSGCAATDQAAQDPADPYEATNREIFDLNLTVDRTFLKPTAEGYHEYVPEGIQDSVHNALGNLNTPVVLANDLLQAEFRRAGQTTGRFLINSTIGIGGLFDTAAKAGIQPHEEDFGQTLAVWGVGDAPYLVLPLLGPSNPRDATGKLVDVALDPTTYIRIKRHLLWSATREYVTILDVRTRNLDALDDIERTSLDFYATAKSLYRQHRASEVRNGTPEP